MHANEEGGLSERARQRAKDLAADSDVRLTAPKVRPVGAPGPTKVATIQISEDERLPMAGAILTRRDKNQVVEVRVLPHGFESEGDIYRSLSAVAAKITGSHWNGYRFFGIHTKGNGDGHQED